MLPIGLLVLECWRDVRVKITVIRSFLALAISANIVDVNFYHSTIAVGEPNLVYIIRLKRQISQFLFVWIGSVRPSQQLWSCWDGQFTLPNFFPGQGRLIS